MRSITYQPGAVLGATVETPKGHKAVAVSALEFHLALFDVRINATAILTMLPPAQAGKEGEYLELEESLVSYYWDKLGGFLLPRRMRKLLVRLVNDDTEGEWFHRVASVTDTLVSAPDMETATNDHVESRLSWLRMGAQGLVSPLHGAGGEFFADYAYLQRAIIEDMREAEENKERGSRIPYLRRLEEEGGFTFEGAFQDMLRADRIANEIPASERPSLARYMEKRRHSLDNGIFAATGLGGRVA